MTGCCTAPSLPAWQVSGAERFEGNSIVAPGTTGWQSRRRWGRFPHQINDRQFGPAREIMFTGQGFNVYLVSLVKRQVPELSGMPCGKNQ
jgi:hypothetical protein